MDFYQIMDTVDKNGIREIYPNFICKRSKDLMIRAKSFYAIWDETTGLWSTDEFAVQRLVDAELDEYYNKVLEIYKGPIKVRQLYSNNSKLWSAYRSYILNLPDNYVQLDEKLTFENSKVKKSDYVSKRLPYSLQEGSIDSYNELMTELYDPEERAKLEWAIGSIISGDSKDIQKFVVLYGEAGSGKSTFLKIIESLFKGYYTSFEARALTNSNNMFSTEMFKSNPLVAIQHDGDLSRIEDNTKLNSIISHEHMTINEKNKPQYMSRINAFLFMGTNKPVRITDAKSGIIRRLIDVRPSGRRIPSAQYTALMSRIEFELGAIANHCLKVYNSMGKNYYASYRPKEMMIQTNPFFNFIESNYFIFEEMDEIGISQAYEMYKQFCDESLVEFKLPRHIFREELKSYFKNFKEVGEIQGKRVRSHYSGFRTELFDIQNEDVVKKEKHTSFVIDNQTSELDNWLAECPAQYTTSDEKPLMRWNNVKTKLSDIDTSKLHYVKPPNNHIVIDFDLKDNTNNKSIVLNLEAAIKWPVTYAEFSKGGAGIHLHYIYDGDVTKLDNVYSDGIEIKTFTGGSSLRRKFTLCNNLPIATLNTGLPLKGEKMIHFPNVQNEKAIRTLIERNLRKEIHPGTKPSIDFIYKILDDAYKNGLKFDVTDMRPRIIAFANNSTNQADTCIKLVNKMKFASDEPSYDIATNKDDYIYDDNLLIFYDVEVFINLFVIVWKKEGGDCVKMINPTAKEIEPLLKFKLVGFNCRRYDNHILYARYIGYSNEDLFRLSQKIIGENRNCLFGEAYNISYADVYDFSSKKQSLKKFEIELGIKHQEFGYPWDKPVPEELWGEVAEYCCNDVIATEAVFHARKADFIARQILADISGLSVNDTTQMHTAKIIFGNDKHPQDKFVYTDLSEMFPGYKYEYGVSTYRDEESGEGGYVYAEPGMYSDVAVLDVASMHPTSLIELNLFGPYTFKFKEIKDARILIKHKNYDILRTMFNGALEKYLGSEQEMEDLSYALKIVINSVYGYTSAKFDNKFRDLRNKDNIVAKRGALFMIDLKYAVQEKGFTVAHIKTDSIKIPNATKDIIDFIFEFGKKYGYIFEHEATYDKFCLVNDAVYIARDNRTVMKCTNKNCEKKFELLTSNGHCPYCNTFHTKWHAIGAQFQHSYVFKTLFSHEPIALEDMCETKTVKAGTMYLDMNEKLADDEHDYHFIGKAGLFCPILSGYDGGLLYRMQDNKYYSVTGTKGYRWLEADIVKKLNKEKYIDISYYNSLVDGAIEDISKYGDYKWFVSNLDDIPFDPPYSKLNGVKICPTTGQPCKGCETNCNCK